MLEYSVKALPGGMSAVVINLLHDLADSHLVEITPACPTGQINNGQTFSHAAKTKFVKTALVASIKTLPPDEEISEVTF